MKKDSEKNRPIRKRIQIWCVLAVLTAACILFGACGSSEDTSKNSGQSQSERQDQKADQEQASDEQNQSKKVKTEEPVTLAEIPAYSDLPYVELADNLPEFTKEDLKTAETSYETYCDLDAWGRCGRAEASVGQDLMPKEERGRIGQVKPSGWHTVKYDCVDGKYLYNRCHLIGYQLTAENANEENLITGTRYMNVEGMLPFENLVADYVKETGNHVLYRVTPIYEGENLVASGVQMEAMSVEDEGDGVCFNVYVYNVQPGIAIDYRTGESWVAAGGDESESDASVSSETPSGQEQMDDGSSDSQRKELSEGQTVIRGNKKSKIYHCPGQADYEEMADSKNLVIFHSEQEAKDAGYRKAKR